LARAATGIRNSELNAKGGPYPKYGLIQDLEFAVKFLDLYCSTQCMVWPTDRKTIMQIEMPQYILHAAGGNEILKYPNILRKHGF